MHNIDQVIRSISGHYDRFSSRWRLCPPGRS